MDCPKEVGTRADILCYNGFGFQSPSAGVKNRFVICFCDDIDQNIIDKIKQETGSTTLEHGDFIGHDYLSVRWDEYNKIVSIFNSILRHGERFTVKNCLEMGFNPQKDKVFSFEAMELKAIEVLSETLKYPNMIDHDVIFPKSLFKIWNWTTPIGKSFCEHIRKLKDKKPPNYDSKHNYYNWEIFKNCDFDTLQNVIAKPHIEKVEKVEKVEKIEEEDVCMICLVNPPNTMVLPCEHCVVCKECSIQLKNTNDRKICVRCRRPITNILD